MGSPFDRLRELALRIPEGAQELLPLIDFMEAFPEQVTEEALVHLVGVSALGIAKSPQGGIWDGQRWIFRRGEATPFPTNPGKGWISLPWVHGDELFGHLALRTESQPAALPLLLSISGPLLAWRRLEARRSDQNRALALQISRLNTLFDLTRSLGEVDTPQALVRLMANTIMGEFRIPRMLVVDASGGVLFNRGLGVLPPSLESDELRRLVLDKGLTHAVELVGTDHSHGFAYAADPVPGTLNEDDELFLQTLLNLTAGQLTNLELHEARLHGIRMEKDLELARNIQRRILPKRLPEPPGWSCAAANLPYQAVGGDLYDLWEAGDPQRGRRLHLSVGDISGKGIPAALMMTQLAAFLHAMGDQRVGDWGRLAHRLNDRMNEVRDRNRYATLFAGSLNPEDGKLRYVNCGHNPPLLVPHSGEARRLAPTGPMVGLLPGAQWCEGSDRMEPGDALVVFTDGLVEAEDAEGCEFGDSSIDQVVKAHPQCSADELLERIFVACFQHLGEGAFRDDVTLLVVRRDA
ncbi:MAG: PP2C family protein-serine/threonine phosphatase [Acidobacteria bacterium]|nr:PP2C family protein-serine/threonine phosphatase [Acidobacteriota bacterium]